MAQLPVMKENLPNNLRKMRKLKGYSSASLADKIGVDKTTITRLETGARRLSMEVATEIAGVLKCEPFDLYKLGPDQDDVSLTDTVRLPFFQTPISLAADLSLLDHEPAQYYDFSMLWLQEQLGQPLSSKMGLFRVPGLSMRPTITSNDLILANIEANKYDGDGIYLIRTIDLLQFKRVILNSYTGKFEVVNEDPAHVIRLESPSIEVHAKALRVIKTIEL